MSERKSSARTSSEQKSRSAAPPPWHVPVVAEDIAEGGQHFALVADDSVRAAVARLAGLRELPRLEANFEVTRRDAGGLHVAGQVSATVGQNCVVTLEPLVNEIDEAIDLDFAPQRPPAPDQAETQARPRDVDLSAPEPLIGGVVDLGALATEFLILGLDPYPRKPGAVFEAPTDSKADAGPFAALAKLTKGSSG
jgi:Large ribosomal RNA subunit accumulation protein YceD